MAEKSRSTVAAVVEETTEGTIVVPSTGTSYIPLIDGGYSMSPSFESITNDEIKSSIGRAQPILGLESPAASLDLYLKHSGTEGQAPNYGVLIEGAFGSETTHSTEYVTASSSTTGVIKVPTGTGANFSAGEALLIKDGTNGYSIRPIESISSDNLTLAFNIDTAPASGVSLGKAVTYTAADSGHPSVSLWYFQANGGAIEAMAGGKISEYSFEANAGEVVKQSFSVEGSKYFFDPIDITSSSKYIDFVTDAGTAAASLTVKTYRDPYELAAEIQSVMDAAAGVSETITCSYNSIGASAGKFTITATGTAVLSLLWNTGSNTANSAKTKLGFSNSDDTGALTYTSDVVQDWSDYQTPAYDDTSLLVAKNQEVYFGDATDNVCYGVQSMKFSLKNNISNVVDICAESGVDSKVFSTREVTADLLLTLKKHEANTFKRFRNGDTVKMMYAFGSKDSGGNWNAGKCGCLYLPSSTITNFEVTNTDNSVTISITLDAYVDSDGNPEVYLNFL